MVSGKTSGRSLGHYVFARVFCGNEPEQSLAHLSEAVRMAPDSISIRFSRAWMLQRLGKMAESLPDLEAAHRLEPEIFASWPYGLGPPCLGAAAESERSCVRPWPKRRRIPKSYAHGTNSDGLGREEEAQVFMEKYQKSDRKVSKSPEAIRDDRIGNAYSAGTERTAD